MTGHPNHPGYTISVNSHTASGKLEGAVSYYDAAQQDEAWAAWRALREAPSTVSVFLSYQGGAVLTSWVRRREDV